MNGLELAKDPSEVYPRIWVGGTPVPPLKHLVEHGISLLVATIEGHGYEGDRVYQTRLTDDAFGIASGDELRARAAADRLVSHVRTEQSALVLCREGLNRSAWVAALAMHALEPAWNGERIIEVIQKERPGALYNWFFCEHIRRVAAGGSIR